MAAFAIPEASSSRSARRSSASSLRLLRLQMEGRPGQPILASQGRGKEPSLIVIDHPNCTCGPTKPVDRKGSDARRGTLALLFCRGVFCVLKPYQHSSFFQHENRSLMSLVRKAISIVANNGHDWLRAMAPPYQSAQLVPITA